MVFPRRARNYLGGRERKKQRCLLGAPRAIGEKERKRDNGVFSVRPELFNGTPLSEIGVALPCLTDIGDIVGTEFVVEAGAADL